jgi:hypothetical protein
MDNKIADVIKNFDALGEVEAKNTLKSLKVTNDPSTEAKKLETFFKSSEETFKKETGRQMTYAEMREMFG